MGSHNFGTSVSWNYNHNKNCTELRIENYFPEKNVQPCQKNLQIFYKILHF